jgi:hypothetical protein
VLAEPQPHRLSVPAIKPVQANKRAKRYICFMVAIGAEIKPRV